MRIENAVIHTMARDGPTCASSMDIRSGRVLALDVPRRAASEAQRSAGDVGSTPSTLDAQGATVVPGFIDCHQHTIMGGLGLLQLDLSAVDGRPAFERAIAQRSRSLAPGEWLEGWGWSEEAWPGRELPNRSWLRSAADRPTVCWRSDHHVCVVNDLVLEMLGAAGVLEQDPPGGRIARDSSGRPTGLLLEAAAWTLVRPRIPAPSIERRREALALAQRHLLSLGLTTVMSMEYARDVREVLTPTRARLRPRMLLTLLDRAWPLEATDAWALATRFENDEHLTLLGFKAFIDGTLGSRTARLLEPYADDPGQLGVLVELAAEGKLRQWIAAVTEIGLSPSMHAIGDGALRLALEVIESLPEHARSLARIEHAQTVHAADLPRTGDRRLSMQPLHRADDGRFAERRLGPARMGEFFPLRSLLEAGARLGFGSDWPIVSPDPLLGMQSAITGLTIDGAAISHVQCLSPEEALVGYTRGAAELLDAARHGLALGTLTPGAVADLVVLDRDPLAVDWRRERPRVLATVVDGCVVHVAPTYSPAWTT